MNDGVTEGQGDVGEEMSTAEVVEVSFAEIDRAMRKVKTVRPLDQMVFQWKYGD